MGRPRSTHPCRKLKLTEVDQRMLRLISDNDGCGVARIISEVPELNTVQIRRRLTQFKKHGYITSTAGLARLRIRAGA